MAKRRFDSEKDTEQPESPEKAEKPEDQEKEGKKETDDIDSLLDEDEKENPESAKKQDTKEKDDGDSDKKEVDDILDEEEIAEKKEGILARFEGEDKKKMEGSLEELDGDDLRSLSDTLDKYDKDKQDGKVTEGQHSEKMRDVPDTVAETIESRKQIPSDEKKIQKILDRPDATQEDVAAAERYRDLKETHSRSFGEELDGRLAKKEGAREQQAEEAEQLADSTDPGKIRDGEVLVQDEVDEDTYTPEDLDELYETFPGDVNERVLDIDSEKYQKTGERVTDWNEESADGYGDSIEGTERMRELQPGEKVMRFGGEGGSYLTDEGTSREKLELPDDKGEEHHYKVVKPIPVVESKVQQQKWNWKKDESSGEMKPEAIDPDEAATQYQTPMSMGQLKKEGYIEEIGDSRDTEEGGEDPEEDPEDE